MNMIKEIAATVWPDADWCLARGARESFAHYQDRRADENRAIKAKLAGNVVWVSVRIVKTVDAKGNDVFVKQRVQGAYHRQWLPQEAALNGMTKSQKKQAKKSVRIFKLMRNGQMREAL